MEAKTPLSWLYRGVLFTLLLCALDRSVIAQPQQDLATLRKSDLVELVTLDSSIQLDIRYATPRNFLGRPVYSEPRAFLQRPAAESLVNVHRALLRRGFGLLVFDGYRPWSVTKEFWEATPPEKRAFVADPAKGSRHNRGCAVDVTLFAVADGREVAMPSPYDEFSERASPRYAGGTVDAHRLRDMLIGAMEAEGFTVEASEWWHFDYRDWQQYPILNTPFHEIR